MAPKKAEKPVAESSSQDARTARRERRNDPKTKVAPVLAKEPRKKKLKTEQVKPAPAKEADEVKPAAAAAAKAEEDPEKQKKGSTVVIEHCKQCNRFKVRAHQVKAGLEDGVPGINVVINPEKPRRGCFEIRKEGGDTFISLLDMKRPFKPMTDLVMEDVIADIVGKIKSAPVA
ncbi:hypothetical protein C5167_034282 [Papaver somniferum]|uniref:Selenoprotein H n=1 Tax=Papaver somniferum TaxID=3469 RepID=A0A4Y7KG16_PAPSO|nr:uncharacterized protein LOC113293236 [Papaver somniferum]RZC71101.1 hypothetical protein C5167_034282 [Papaver somniferum]